jgi:hypothetical protein
MADLPSTAALDRALASLEAWIALHSEDPAPAGRGTRKR